MFDELGNNNFCKLHLVDFKAGSADDFVLFGKDDILKAYQFKTTTGNITYNSFCNNKQEGFLYEFALAWQSLKKTYPKYKLRIIFNTSELLQTIPHHMTFMPGDNLESKDKTLKLFLENTLIPIKTGLVNEENLIEKWKEPWDYWKKATGLTNDMFFEFIDDFSFEFNYKFPQNTDFLRYTNLRDLYELYFEFHSMIKNAKDTKKIVILDEENIQYMLGIERFSLKNEHIFPSSDFYIPINESKAKVLDKIKSTTSGYLALVGTPGSGKSSLLQDISYGDYENLNFISYYNYIPNEYGQPIRGESSNFLFDITKLIENTGITSDERLPDTNIDYNRKKFKAQLFKLGERYKNTKKKIILIIDGLDHINREHRIATSDSLIHELISPSNFPDGIIFLLGTQHLNDLHPEVRLSLNQDSNIIEMQSMNKSQVFDILETAEIPNKIFSDRDLIDDFTNEFKTTQDLVDHVYMLTGGHPLIVNYLLNKLDGVTDPNDVLKNITQFTPYEGDIAVYYNTHWDEMISSQMIQTSHLKTILAIIARIPNYLNFEWIRKNWERERESVKLFELHLQYFFRKITDNLIDFFHNSFRNFLTDKTQEILFGNSKDEDMYYHKQIADVIDPNDQDYMSWNLIYHLWEAKELTRIVDISNRDYFKSQIFDFRPIDDIITDLQNVLQASLRLKQGDKFIQNLILLDEMYRYKHALSGNYFRFLNLLIRNTRVENFILWVLKNQKLRDYDLNLISDGKLNIFDIIPSLFKIEMKDTAKLVFLYSDKIYRSHVRDGVDIYNRDRTENLESYFIASTYFEKLDIVFEKIDQLLLLEGRGKLDIDSDKYHKSKLKIALIDHILEYSHLITFEQIIHDFAETENNLEFMNFLQILDTISSNLISRNQLQEAMKIIDFGFSRFDSNNKLLEDLDYLRRNEQLKRSLRKIQSSRTNLFISAMCIDPSLTILKYDLIKNIRSEDYQDESLKLLIEDNAKRNFTNYFRFIASLKLTSSDFPNAEDIFLLFFNTQIEGIRPQLKTQYAPNIKIWLISAFNIIYELIEMIVDTITNDDQSKIEGFTLKWNEFLNLIKKLDLHPVMITLESYIRQLLEGFAVFVFELILPAFEDIKQQAIVELINLLINEKRHLIWNKWSRNDFLLEALKFASFNKDSITKVNCFIQNNFDFNETSTKIDHGLKIADLFTRLGDNQNSLFWLKKSLANLIGVRDRKDYILSFGIEWLGVLLMNPLRPRQIKMDYINKYSEVIEHYDHYIEWNQLNDATKELIQNVYLWDKHVAWDITMRLSNCNFAKDDIAVNPKSWFSRYIVNPNDPSPNPTILKIVSNDGDEWLLENIKLDLKLNFETIRYLYLNSDYDKMGWKSGWDKIFSYIISSADSIDELLNLKKIIIDEFSYSDLLIQFVEKSNEMGNIKFAQENALKILYDSSIRGGWSKYYSGAKKLRAFLIFNKISDDPDIFEVLLRNFADNSSEFSGMSLGLESDLKAYIEILQVDESQVSDWIQNYLDEIITLVT